jgi:hypothetical protein
MSEPNRGAYAPPTADTPLSFDARQPVRGARPFPVTLIISGLVLVGLVVVIFLFYRSGVREAGQGPQAVGTPVGEIKSPAPADAQPQDPAAGLQIYQSEGSQPARPQAGAPNFVPPPEQPAERPSTPLPAAAPPVGPVASAALRPALPPAPAAEPAPQAVAPPAPAKPAKAPVVEKAPVKAVAEKPVAKPPVEKPIVEKPAAKAPPATSESAKAAVGGGAAVQIGAVSSTALSETAWKEAVAVAPGLAAGKGKGVEKIDKDGHVLYRTAVTGFASRAEAGAFCAKLKAAGKACFVK